VWGLKGKEPYKKKSAFSEGENFLAIKRARFFRKREKRKLPVKKNRGLESSFPAEEDQVPYDGRQGNLGGDRSVEGRNGDLIGGGNPFPGVGEKKAHS